MPQSLDQLVYRSRSFMRPDDVEGLAQLVQTAAANNVRASITGALALRDGWFVQMLEGSPAALDQLILQLHFDTRHSEIDVLDRVRVTHRAFPDWGMVAPELNATTGRELVELVEARTEDIRPFRRVFQALLVDRQI